MSSTAYRKFAEELIAFMGKRVSVETSEGKSYEGLLLGLDERLNIIIDTVSGAGANVFKVVLNGDYVKEIRLLEKPFDLKALADRMNRVFPGLVRIREDIGALIVMDKIKVTEAGITEGSGLSAERAKAVYDEFIRETKKK